MPTSPLFDLAFHLTDAVSDDRRFFKLLQRDLFLHVLTQSGELLTEFDHTARATGKFSCVRGGSTMDTAQHRFQFVSEVLVAIGTAEAADLGELLITESAGLARYPHRRLHLLSRGSKARHPGLLKSEQAAQQIMKRESARVAFHHEIARLAGAGVAEMILRLFLVDDLGEVDGRVPLVAFLTQHGALPFPMKPVTP